MSDYLQMLEDPETMSYNRAWGGTIPFPKERWEPWHDRWIAHPQGKRFYRYLRDEETGAFVGEIACHYDPACGGYAADVLIFSKYRGKGYGKRGLELLCEAAKENGITVLYDEIAADNPAVGMFLRQGFSVERRTEKTVVLNMMGSPERLRRICTLKAMDLLRRKCLNQPLDIDII